MNYLQRDDSKGPRDDSKGPLSAAKIHLYMFCMRKKTLYKEDKIKEKIYTFTIFSIV